MKKYYVIILCLLFIAGVTSCATKQEKKAAPAALVNPITELEAPDFSSAGFKVVEYPLDYTLTRCASIDDRIGEMDFDIAEGLSIVFRVAKETDEDISGVHYEFTEVTHFDSSNVPVTLKKSFEPSYDAVAAWNKDGYTFSLWIYAQEEPADSVKIIENFLENVVMEPDKI